MNQNNKSDNLKSQSYGIVKIHYKLLTDLLLIFSGYLSLISSDKLTNNQLIFASLQQNYENQVTANRKNRGGIS